MSASKCTMTINSSTQRIAILSQTPFDIYIKEKHTSLKIYSTKDKCRLSTTLVAFAFHHNHYLSTENSTKLRLTSPHQQRKKNYAF